MCPCGSDISYRPRLWRSHSLPMSRACAYPVLRVLFDAVSLIQSQVFDWDFCRMGPFSMNGDVGGPGVSDLTLLDIF